MLRIILCDPPHLTSICPRGPPQPSENPTTGKVNRRGEAPPPSAPSPIRSDSAPADSPAGVASIPSEVGNAQQLRHPHYDCTRRPRNYRKGYRWEDLPTPKHVQDSEPPDSSKKGVTPDATSTPKRGGHRDSPPHSPASHLCSGSWTQHWRTQGTCGRKPQSKNPEKLCFLYQK